MNNLSSNLRKAVLNHEKMLTEAINSSKKILEYSTGDDVNRVGAEVKNRDRLINIIKYVQTKIETALQVLNKDEFSEEVSVIISNWQESFAKSIATIADYDYQILSNLEKKSGELKSEISLINQSKKDHKGYDLRSVKR